MLIDGRLTTGHARALLALPTDKLQWKIANRVLARRLSVREVESLVRRSAYITDLESKLTGQLGTKVTIETRKNGQRGKITIEFYSLDEFDRITERLGLTELEEV